MSSVNLGIWLSPVHQESFLYDQRWTASLDFESRFGPGQTDGGDSLSSEHSFPFLVHADISSFKLPCPSLQGALSQYPHHLYLVTNNLFSVWIIFLRISFIDNGSSDKMQSMKSTKTSGTVVRPSWRQWFPLGSRARQVT